MGRSFHMAWVFLLTLAATTISGCVSTAAKDNVEFQMNKTVGQNIYEYFRDSPGLECADKAEERDCSLLSKSGCRIAFTVSSENRILAWRYGGLPEDCWHLGHSY
jgi:hypothetical protein